MQLHPAAHSADCMPCHSRPCRQQAKTARTIRGASLTVLNMVGSVLRFVNTGGKLGQRPADGKHPLSTESQQLHPAADSPQSPRVARWVLLAWVLCPAERVQACRACALDPNGQGAHHSVMRQLLRVRKYLGAHVAQPQLGWLAL